MKVLIVKLSSMGDLIGILPALTDAQKAIPNITFDWVSEENFIEIPKWHPAVGSIIPFALRRWRKKPWNLAVIKEIGSFWKNLREKNYDYIIDSHGLLKSSIVATSAHGTTCGFSFNNAREPLASFFYKNKFDVEKNLHVTKRARKLFSLALNYKTSSELPDYGIMKEKMKKKASSEEKYLVFAHGTSRKNKYWPEEKWIELASLAKTAGIKVKLPWGNKEEFDRANNIALASNNGVVLPKLNLSELSDVLISSEGLVAVDTGLGHLAAALEIPTISLYGPTNPKLGGAYGKNQIHLTNMSMLSAEMVWQKIKNNLEAPSQL